MIEKFLHIHTYILLHIKIYTKLKIMINIIYYFAGFLEKYGLKCCVLMTKKKKKIESLIESLAIMIWHMPRKVLRWHLTDLCFFFLTNHS